MRLRLGSCCRRDMPPLSPPAPCPCRRPCGCRTGLRSRPRGRGRGGSCPTVAPPPAALTHPPRCGLHEHFGMLDSFLKNVSGIPLSSQARSSLQSCETTVHGADSRHFASAWKLIALHVVAQQKELGTCLRRGAQRQRLEARHHRRQPGVDRRPVLPVHVGARHQARRAQVRQLAVQRLATGAKVLVRPACGEVKKTVTNRNCGSAIC